MFLRMRRRFRWIFSAFGLILTSLRRADFIHWHCITLTKAIEEHVLDKLTKLENLDQRALDARVTLEHDRCVQEDTLRCVYAVRARTFTKPRPSESSIST